MMVERSGNPDKHKIVVVVVDPLFTPPPFSSCPCPFFGLCPCLRPPPPLLCVVAHPHQYIFRVRYKLWRVWQSITDGIACNIIADGHHRRKSQRVHVWGITGRFTPRSFHTQVVSHPGRFTPRSFHTQVVSHPFLAVVSHPIFFS